MPPDRMSPDTVRRLARLARLGLSDAEVERLATELAGVLGHFEALRELVPASEADAEDVVGRGDESEEGAARPGRAALREDVESADPLRAPPSTAAPRWEDGFFLVPRLPGLGDR